MSQFEPATIFVRLMVRKGSERAFEAEVRHWLVNCRKLFTHLVIQMLRPMTGDREYGAVFMFQSHREWQAFQQSAAYLQFQAVIRTYLDSEPEMKTMCGLESWFTPLGSRVAKVPPRWKMAIVTWIGVCLSVYCVTVLFTPVTGLWPWLLNFVTINAGVVVALTWWVMPLLNRLFEPWLLTSRCEINSDSGIQGSIQKG